MELVERYLHAVQFWLPAGMKRDITAELSEDLQAQIEEREAELGRKLTDQEISDLLKRRGSPMLVANSFLPQRSLIGPLLYPIYVFVMRIVFIGLFVQWAITMVVRMAFSPALESGWITHVWTDHLNEIAGTLWNSTFITAGVVTLIFVVLERTVPDMCARYQWDPQKLPKVRNANKIPRANSYFEVAFGLIFGVWFASSLYSPVILNGPNARLVLTPEWSYFYWSFLLITVASAALSAANMAHPYWTRLKAMIRMLIDLSSGVLACWFFKANLVAEFSLAKLTPEQSQSLLASIHLWINRFFPLLVVAVIGTAAYDIYRIVRVRDEDELEGGLGAPVSNFHSR